MVNVISSKHVTTKTPHNCWGCKSPILIGTTVQCVTSVDGGSIASVYWCDTCEEFMSTLDSYDMSDGFCFGELAEMADYPSQAQHSSKNTGVKK